VYDLPKVAGAPLGPLARDGVDTVDTLGAVASTIRVVVNGKPETIETVSDPRHLGGAQRYFLCACGRRVWHLYYVRAAERLVCRRCAGPLGYRSKHTRQRGLNRARRLEKIGALPSPLAPLPPKPKFWRQDYWTQAVARTAVAEAALAAQLHAMVVRVRRRRLRHEHSNRDARRT
jgi:hypothetical protein